MLTSLKKFLAPDPYQLEAHRAYAKLVAPSRREYFYRELKVPDTLDGRFDVLVLHVFFVVHRLRDEKAASVQAFSRALQEAFFNDMDRSIREMGVSDTGVGKRIKKMAQAFYGRLEAYDRDAPTPDAFQKSLLFNLYRGQPVEASVAAQWMEYCRACHSCLEAQTAEAVMAVPDFPSF